MNPGMMRWKITPSYNGSVDFSPVAGWVHSISPVASPTKFFTVFGAWWPYRSTLIGPWLVLSVATAV